MTGPTQRREVAGTAAHPADAALPRQRARRHDVAAADRLLSVGAAPTMDRLAGLAARLLGAASAQVSLLTDVQTVAGSAGRGSHAAGSAGALADSLCALTATEGIPLVVTDARTDPRVLRLPPVVSGLVGTYLGVPLIEAAGSAVGALCVYDPAPRGWSPDEVALLGQLAAFTVTELELAALGGEHAVTLAQWALAADAADIGGFDYDLHTGRLDFDERMLELFGYDGASFDHTGTAFTSRVHPDDLPRISAAAAAATRTSGVYEAEYRVIRPDGSTRWVRGRGRVLRDEAGTAVRLLGVSFDTTEARDAEARVGRMLETLPVAVVSLGVDWRFTYVNAEAERILGQKRIDLLGGDMWTLYPALAGSPFERNYRDAVRTRRPVSFEAYYPEPLNAWFEVRVSPTPDGLWVHFLDVTLRRAVQRHSAETLLRTALLAQVTADLVGATDVDEAAGRLADIVVPALADWCLVRLADPDLPGPISGRLRDAASGHRDPDRRDTVSRYAALPISGVREESFAARVLTNEDVVHIATGATAALAGSLEPGERRDLLTKLAPESMSLFPLVANGRRLGVLALFYDTGSTHNSGEILATATEVATRAALALDNVRLYDQQRRIAEGLQRSLLSVPPAATDLQIAVRYQPAAEAAQVGGDWYDSFRQPDGAMVLVIGDVVGHDLQAATAMGQLRGLLRGIAATTTDGPGAVLSRLDAAMRLLDGDTTATAVVCRIERAADRRGHPVERMRWSNAGHPPPMLITHAGRVRALDAVESDVMLGVAPDLPRVESTLTLPAGATVLLYTDGLIERRGQSLDQGLRWLRRALGSLAGHPVGELCDEVLARTHPGSPEDDVALLAVRVGPA